MKKIAFNSLLVIALGGIFFTSCNKDEENQAQIPTDNAKQNLKEASSDMSQDIVEIIRTEGIEGIHDLVDVLDVDDPFSGRIGSEDKKAKRWLKTRAAEFKTIFVPSKSINSGKIEEDGFNFDDNKGIYDWNPTIEQFEKSNEISDIIVVNFPTEESDINNAVLRILSYEETLIIETDEDWTDEYYEPTRIEADLSIDGTEQISLDFSASYNSEGIPTEGTATLFVKPYTVSVAFNNASSTSASLKSSITKAGETLVAVDYSVSFTDVDKEFVDEISGFTQFSNLKLQGRIDVHGIDTSVEDDIDLNDYIDLELHDVADGKIGDVIFEMETDEDGYEDYVPYLIYSDGSKEKFEDIFQSVIDDVEAELEKWDD